MRLLHRFIDEVEVKRCCMCHKWLPLENFNKGNTYWDKHQPRCKACRSTKHKVEKVKDYSQGRVQHLKRTFGLTVEDYNNMFEQQGGVCAICGGLPNGITKGHLGRNFSVDHDHKTGKVRGLICANCNHGLGFFKDSIEALSKAIEYLNRSRE